MNIVILDEKFEKKYDDFLMGNKNSLIYASNVFRRFLKGLLGDKDYYLLAIDDNNQILGALPTFLKQNGKYGNILNSLPYYGSNGGILVKDNDINVKRLLLEEYKKLAEELKCVSSTLVTSPFETELETYKEILHPTFEDHRIGQITIYPDDLINDIISIYESRQRWSVNKAIKQNVEVEIDNSDEAMNFLKETHMISMRLIGGIAKESSFFNNIKDCMRAGEDYDLYVAYKNNERIAALLILYFNKTVEYYCPVTVSEYRSDQPLALIIYNAMKVSMEKGFRYWNWGGTWETQSGVYDFKKGWGTEDFPYYYYTIINDDKILNLSKEELLIEYKNYYVAPFNQLRK